MSAAKDEEKWIGPISGGCFTAIVAPDGPHAASRADLARGTEPTKYAADALLAMKITFINEMADLCEKVGADVHGVARGIGLDGRIGRKFLHAGPGYGGSCFPKDKLALMRTAQDYGAPSRLVKTTVAVNDARKSAMAMRVIAACAARPSGARADLQAGDRRRATRRHCRLSRGLPGTEPRSAPSIRKECNRPNRCCPVA